MQAPEMSAMQDTGTLLADLKACSRTRNLEKGKQVHARAVSYGLDSRNRVASALVTMYTKCGSMEDARQVFRSIENPNVVSWTVLLLGYVDNGQGLLALELFRKLKSASVVPDYVVFVAALKACSALAVNRRAIEWGKQIHNLSVETGCYSEIILQNTLIDMYTKCRSMVEARRVFNTIEHPTVVSWTALILGYADNGKGFTALDLFKKMGSGDPGPDSVTFVAALRACASLAVKERVLEFAECRDRGKRVHILATESGCGSEIYVQGTLIDMYASCGSMVDAHQVFNGIRQQNVVSWTSLIVGYADNGQGLTALDLFTRMKKEGPAPNSITFAAALRACALVGGLDFGRAIHSEIVSGNHLNAIVVNCLVDFYARCGCLVEAQRVFDLHSKTRNVITWTALLAGFSNSGDHETVFRLFETMLSTNLLPDAIIFVCILTCCSHAGLVEKGKEFFAAMSTKYGLAPTVEHYTCMVDILGRANRLDDAMALLQSMPCSPDEVTWMTVLSACRKWKNVEVGRLAFQSLASVPSAYVLMGQLYGSRGMLQEQEMVMNKLRASSEDCITQRPRHI